MTPEEQQLILESQQRIQEADDEALAAMRAANAAVVEQFREQQRDVLRNLGAEYAERFDAISGEVAKTVESIAEQRQRQQQQFWQAVQITQPGIHGASGESPQRTGSEAEEHADRGRSLDAGLTAFDFL